METTDEQICGACGLAYDWKPVTADGERYCCDACARGRPCTCPEHSDAHASRAMGSRSGSSILGATQGEL